MGQIKIKDHLSPAEAEVGAELGNFRLKGEGGGVRIGQFSTKKNNCLKHSKWPKKHFKTNLFFPFLGGGGLFTRTEFLSFETLSSDHLATTRRPVSYKICYMTCRSFSANKNFVH